MSEQLQSAVPQALTSMMERAKQLQLLLTLIERATSSALVRNFLKEKKLPHSASSWEELKTKRLIPAIEQGALSLQDLHGLLRRTEGFGKQHIFLYKCPPARAELIISETRIRRLLAEKGIAEIENSPLVVDLPESPTLVDVAFKSVGAEKSVTLKEIERRTTKKLRSEQLDRATMTYGTTEQFPLRSGPPRLAARLFTMWFKSACQHALRVFSGGFSPLLKPLAPFKSHFGLVT